MNKDDNSILLVEDNKKHMADAKRVLDQFGIVYDSVHNLADALGFFKEYSTSGILSDVFFPFSEAGVERPSGVILCEYALEQRIPIVLCTSTYHHGPKTSPINRYARKQGIPLVDSEDVEGDEEAEVKDWDKAVLELLVQQAIMENPTFSSQKEILNAYKLAIKTRKNKLQWVMFNKEIEKNLNDTLSQLKNRTYIHWNYKKIILNDGKKRYIFTPHIRDHLVHH